MTQRSKRLFALLGVSAAMSAAALPVAQAKNGADDPVNHDVNDDNGGLVVNQAPRSDDPVNHDVNDDRTTTVRKPEARHHHRHGRHHHRHHRHDG
ncbi:MAG TPA: hypothetical protein VJU60_08425 [Thermoleophilaceae bacterium]|nr:hypothetical protein [Thermoleophilaceae bacterium]